MTVAVGFFDGVHLGHRSILEGADAALTFKSHPLSVLAPDRAPRLLMDFSSRVSAIKSCGVAEVRAFDFTPEFAALSPDEFLAEASIVPGVKVRCGENWRFGRGGAADADYLRARGVEVEVVPYVQYRGEPVSSTRIRASLESGDVEDANAMLGRPFEVHGASFPGKGEGARLGYPTLNLDLDEGGVKLPLGVYAVESGGIRGVANYGFAPTFGDRAWHKPVMEVHFLGPRPEETAGHARGAESPADRTTVSLLGFLRPERRFESLSALKAQIALDCDRAAACTCVPGA